MALALAGACTASEPEPDPVNRLAILDQDDRVVTLAPDGSDQVTVSDRDDVAFQPTWSPDGNRLAYTSTGSGLTIADLDTGALDHLDTDVSPFYLHWSPQGDQLAALRNAPDGIALEMVTIGADGLDANVMDTGQPYYFSWRPDGERLVVHVGTDRLDILDPAGGAESLEVAPGTFQAPDWTAAGIVAARLSDEGGELVLVTDSGHVEVIAEHDGGAVFAASATGRQVAVQTLASDDGETTRAALVDEPLTGNRLHVVDLESGGLRAVTETPAVAFFWSPDGERLLVLELRPETQELQWSVWRDGELTSGPAFGPTVSWVQTFLPFYDQYARSMTLWSPESTAFAFPGQIGGEEGIWVHEVDTDSTTKVADGSWVAWSRS